MIDIRRLSFAFCALAVAACEPSSAPPVEQAPPVDQSPRVVQAAGPKLSADQALSNFRAVVARIEPVAERECRARTPQQNCDFLIKIDRDPRKPPNAFQTLDRAGRPIIGFTLSLVRDARNRDELAFIFGHEAAHHIKGHIRQQQGNAVGGAILGGILAAGLGVDPSVGSDLGGFVGSRAFSKEAELEADGLGTIIAKKAGYDPVRGAAFFSRIPDPGDRFLGTHPPNRERIETVRRVDAQL